MRGKGKGKKYDEAIVIRVTKELKADIYKRAEEARREPADYLRIIVQDAVKNQTIV